MPNMVGYWKRVVVVAVALMIMRTRERNYIAGCTKPLEILASARRSSTVGAVGSSRVVRKVAAQGA